MPRLFGFATLIILASIGVPAFAPFIGEILTVISAMFSDLNIILKICAIGALPLLILSSCYMLKFLHCGFMGEKQEVFAKINDIKQEQKTETYNNNPIREKEENKEDEWEISFEVRDN